MHWTYEILDDDSDLRQGDILEPTEEMSNLFKKFLPYFTHEKYLGFLILTQSCDMVRRKDRGNKCNASHISLSAIRSLQEVISDSYQERFGFLAPGIYAQHMKKSVRDLAERLINQNENALGLFYLHEDGDSGITVHSVATLRVAISFRAAEHYHTLKKARVGRLSKEFRPKLGWMVGNLFSRVGVTDWKEISEEEEQNIEEMIIKDILSFNREEPIWLERKLFKKMLKKQPDFCTLQPPEQEKIINDFLPTPPKDRIIEIITKTVKDVSPKIQDNTLEIIKQRLVNNDQFEAQMRKFVKHQ